MGSMKSPPLKILRRFKLDNFEMKYLRRDPDDQKERKEKEEEVAWIWISGG